MPLITGALLRGGSGEPAIGRVYAANTLGAIGGVLVAVHLGLPLLGLKGTLILGALIDAALGLALLYRFAPRLWPFAAAAAACVLAFAPVMFLFELNANKLTAGVFRHGDLSSSQNAEVLFGKDGKTATVHLVRYTDATSIRTNGKSDGSINLNPEGARGSDEITMTLVAAIPLALKPEAKSAAVIGIGTGLTMHTLLQNLSLAKELEGVHVLAPGDLDARYLGDRAALDPLFASYGMPANSDYYPVLDLNAARHRFTEKSATDVVALLNAGVPVLDMLQPALRRRAVNAQHRGAGSFERVENTRLARYARDFLLDPAPPEPEGIPTLLQKDLELSKLRLIECRQPREQDVWLHSLIHVARTVNPYLAPAEAQALWARFTGAPCFAALRDFQRRWIGLFEAVGARHAARSAEHATALLADQQELTRDAREYLVMAGMTGHLAAGNPRQALELWKKHGEQMRGAGKPVFRLLRCHAERETQPQRQAAACTAAFAAYAGG